MTGIDEFCSFSYIIDVNRLKNVYDVDFDYGSANDYVDAVTGFLQRWEENGYELDESVIIRDDEEDFVV